jgi:SAM-dependent methyltransferase
MSERIQYNQCPACFNTEIKKVLECKDYTVSKEPFEVWECVNCTMRFTNNVPSANHMGPYYKSADYVSHSNSKKGLVNKLYHMVRNYTLGTKLQLIKSATCKEEGSLLDVGAGTGAFANKMQQAGWTVNGLEPDEMARRNALNSYNLQLQTLDDLHNFPVNSFDVITMWHVLEHVHDLHAYLTTFEEILKRDGKLFIAVPNYTSFDAKLYGRFWAAYDVPRHLYHFSPKSMQILLAGKGFKLAAKRPMWFDSFYVCLLSERYKTGSLNSVGGFINGLRSNIKAVGDKARCSSIIYVVEKK